MKSTAKSIEHRQAELHIEAEADEYAAATAEAYKHLAQRATVPGFRKGKAPRHVLEQHLGREAVVDEAIEHVFPDIYEKALVAHELQPIATPQVELEQREPPTFKVIVPLTPEVTLGDYRSVRVKPEEVSVTDEHVLGALDRIRESQAVLAPVARALKFADFATIDVKATVEGQPFLDHQQVTYQAVAASPMPVPGFAEAIVGMAKDETREFTLRMPDDFRVAELAGKDCSCTVTVREVKQKELPELGDGLAKTFGFETFDALKEKVGADLESNARNQARTTLIHSALDAIAAQGSVDFPPVLEEREIADLLQGEARRYGYKTIEDYLKMTNRSVDEIREDLRPLAHTRIVNGLILEKLAEAEGIEVADADIAARIEELVTETKDKDKARQFLSSPEMRESIETRLRTNRTLDRLVAMVTGSTEPGTATPADGAEPASAPEVESHG